MDRGNCPPGIQRQANEQQQDNAHAATDALKDRQAIDREEQIGCRTAILARLVNGV